MRRSPRWPETAPRARPRSSRPSCAPRPSPLSCSPSWPRSASCPAATPPDLEAAAEALESATVPLWRGPAEGRVRVLDPYSVRAGRARHLFCAGAPGGRVPPPIARRPAARRRAPRPARNRLAGPPRSARRGALPVSRLRLAADRAPLPLLAGQPTTTAPRPRARRSSTRSSTCSGRTPRPRSASWSSAAASSR